MLGRVSAWSRTPAWAAAGACAVLRLFVSGGEALLSADLPFPAASSNWTRAAHLGFTLAVFERL